MSDGLDSLFEPLEPPRGGLAGLRARIERDGRRRRRVSRLRVAGALAGTLCAAVLLVVTTLRPDPDPLEQELRLARLRLGLRPLSEEGLTVPPAHRSSLAVARVPTATDAVLFYWVAALEPDSETDLTR